MTNPNRVMRLNKNPAGRGFIVRVLEETNRDDSLGVINFRPIATQTHVTRAAADRAWQSLKAEYCAR